MGIPMTYISGNTGAYQSGTFNKGTIALNLNPSSLGPGNNWYNGVDVTATQYLIYSDTYSQGQASQATSKPTAWTTPDLSDSSLLALINTLPDRVGVLPFTSLPLALQWLNGTNEYFLIKTNSENIVTSGLVLNLDAGLYNSYSGTTTWFDRSGNGNNGTLTNGPTFNGSSQGAIVFDGTDDYVVISSNSNLGPGTGDFTYSAWVNPVSYTFYSGFLVVAITGGLWIGKNGSNFVLRGYDVADFLQYGTLPSTGQWTNVTITRTGTLVTLYYNGISVQTANTNHNFIHNTAYVGNDGPVTSANFNGRISTTLFYKGKSLSPQEVLQNYNAQKSRFGIYDFVQSGLTYSYDAGNFLSYPRSGTTWSNMSNGSNNGTLINGPTFITGATPSIQFDGTNDYVSAGNGKTLNNMTFQMSVKVNSNAGMYKAFGGAVGNGFDYNSGFNIDMQQYSRSSFDRCSIEGGFLRIDGGLNFMTSSVPFGTWKNICFTISPTYIQFYLDGVKQLGTNRLNNASSTIGMNNLVIGVRPIFIPSGIDANIRDVMIYDRAIGDSEVVQNFESSRNKSFGLTGYTTSGLTLNLDAGNYASYPTTGTKWVDISGSYNNGTITNGPVWSNTNGGIITLDGIDDYVNIGNRTNLQMGTGDFTMCLWVKMNNPPNTYGSPYINVLFNCKDAAAATAGYGITFFYGGGNQNKLLWSTGNGSSAVEILTQNTFPELLGAWGHIVMVRQNGSTNNGCFYVNGVLQPLSSSATVLNVNTTTNMTIGNTSDRYGSYYTKGDFAIAQIYNRALTANEVLQNYNATKGRFDL